MNMKFNNISIVFGILLAVALGLLAYLSFILAIVLSFLGYDWFVVMVGVFGVLAILTLVGAVLARKKIGFTVAVNFASFLVVLATNIFLFVIGVLNQNTGLLAVFLSVMVLAGITTFFAVVAKRKNNHVVDKMI